MGPLGAVRLGAWLLVPNRALAWEALLPDLSASPGLLGLGWSLTARALFVRALSPFESEWLRPLRFLVFFSWVPPPGVGTSCKVPPKP